MNPLDAKRRRPQALVHILYEIWMLLRTYRDSRRKDGWDSVRSNAYLESFVIHARNLDEFFGSEKTSGGRMTLAHFGFSEALSPKRHRDIGRMNDEICHLNFNRKSSGEKGDWRLDRALGELVDPCLAFLDYAARDESMMRFEKNEARTHSLIEELRQMRAQLRPTATSSTNSETVQAVGNESGQVRASVSDDISTGKAARAGQVLIPAQAPSTASKLPAKAASPRPTE